MTRWLAAAKAAKWDNPVQPPEPQAGEVLSVKSVLSEGERPAVTPPNLANNVAQAATTATFRHGRSPGGRPLTWTGHVVSLDEWRNLSDWDRHGPNGRRWCGNSKGWRD